MILNFNHPDLVRQSQFQIQYPVYIFSALNLGHRECKVLVRHPMTAARPQLATEWQMSAVLTETDGDSSSRYVHGAPDGFPRRPTRRVFGLAEAQIANDSVGFCGGVQCHLMEEVRHFVLVFQQPVDSWFIIHRFGDRLGGCFAMGREQDFRIVVFGQDRRV